MLNKKLLINLTEEQFNDLKKAVSSSDCKTKTEFVRKLIIRRLYHDNFE